MGLAQARISVKCSFFKFVCFLFSGFKPRCVHCLIPFYFMFCSLCTDSKQSKNTIVCQLLFWKCKCCLLLLNCGSSSSLLGALFPGRISPWSAPPTLPQSASAVLASCRDSCVVEGAQAKLSRTPTPSPPPSPPPHPLPSLLSPYCCHHLDVFFSHSHHPIRHLKPPTPTRSPNPPYSQKGAQSASQCKCEPGFYDILAGGGDNINSNSSSRSSSDGPSCSACPYGGAGWDSAGAVSVTACSCPPGRYMDEVLEMCTECEAGTFKVRHTGQHEKHTADARCGI